MDDDGDLLADAVEDLGATVETQLLVKIPAACFFFVNFAMEHVSATGKGRFLRSLSKANIDTLITTIAVARPESCWLGVWKVLLQV